MSSRARLALWLIPGCLIVSLLVSAVEATSHLDSDLAATKERLRQIAYAGRSLLKNAQGGGAAPGYGFDLLADIVALPDVEYAEAGADGDVVFYAGVMPAEAVIQAEVPPLVDGGLGLRLYASAGQVRQHTLAAAWDDAMRNLLIAAVTGVVLVLLVDWMVARGLRRMLHGTALGAIADRRRLEGAGLGSSHLDDIIGRVGGVVARASDVVTERERYYQQVIDHAADGVIVIDDKGIIQSFNRSAVEMFGYSANEVLDRNVSMLMPEPDRSRHDGYLNSYVTTNVSKVMGIGRDVLGQRKDGTVFPLALRMSELPSADGEHRFVGSVRDITERKRMEDALRRGEALYRRAEEIAGLGHWVWTVGAEGSWQGGVSKYSEGGAAIFGVSPGDLAVATVDLVERFVHPEDRESVLRAYAGIMEPEHPGYAVEYRAVRPGGSVAYVLEIGETVVDKDNRLLRTMGTLQDITERKVMEIALRESEARLRAFLDNAPIGMYVKDLQGRYLMVNREDEHVFEHATQGVLGGSAEQFFEPAALEKILAQDREVVSSGGTVTIELHEPGRKRYVWSLVTKFPILGADGKIVAIGGIDLDITDRKRLETALQESEARMREFLDNAPMVMTIKDIEGRYVMLNREAERTFGGPAEQFLGRRVSDLYDATLVAQIEAMDRDAMTRGEPVRRELVFGERTNFQATLTTKFPIRDAGGTLIGLGTIDLDIAAQKALERELIAAKKQAEMANRAKSDFLANMSHELRTPLNAVIGFSEAILRGIGGPTTEKQTEYLGYIEGAGRHLLEVINDVLDMSRIEAGRFELRDQAIDLKSLVERCGALVRHQCEAKNMSLEIAEMGALPSLTGDELALKKIVINLLSNAVKFTPEGGRVSLAVDRDPGGDVILRVSDTGIGIEPEDIPLVLEPFRQVDNTLSRRYEGAGLGLPLARSLAELHGGALEIDSVVGHGTTVRVRLPAWRAATH